MKYKTFSLVFFLALALAVPPSAFEQATSSVTETNTEEAIRRYGVDHDRERLRVACVEAITKEPSYALPYFYLGVLDESEENWLSAKQQFEQFVAKDGDSKTATLARAELKKLPALIKEDSTQAGKLNRQYRQHLGFAEFLQKRGFTREAFLETAQAAKLLPTRWEAYATASSILLSQHDLKGANHFLDLARANLPADSVGKLDDLSDRVKRVAKSEKSHPTEMP